MASQKKAKLVKTYKNSAKKHSKSINHALTTVMVTNRLNFTAEYYPYLFAHPNLFGFTKIEEVTNSDKYSTPDFYKKNKSLVQAQVKNLLSFFVMSLTRAGYAPLGAWYEIHDSDLYTQADERENPKYKAGTVKSIHYHLVFKWGYRKGPTVKVLAQLLGLFDETNPDRIPQAIQLPRSRYSFDNFLAYLIHAKSSEKYQYSADSVVTLVGDDYRKIADSHSKAWLKGKLAKKQEAEKEQLVLLEDDIIKGKWTVNDFKLKYPLLYASNKQQLDYDFQVSADNRSYLARQAFDDEKIMKTSIFIQGASGSGKTRLARDILKSLRVALKEITGKTYDYSQGSRDHPFDLYRGELFSWLDDFRGYANNAETVYKALDPYSAGVVDARYHDRLYVPRLVVLTSIQSALRNAYFLKGAGGKKQDAKIDTLEQFLRRLSFVFYAEGNNSYYVDYIEFYPDGVDIDFSDDPIVKKDNEIFAPSGLTKYNQPNIWRLHYWSLCPPPVVRGELVKSTLDKWFYTNGRNALALWNKKHSTLDDMVDLMTVYMLCMLGYASEAYKRYKNKTVFKIAYDLAYCKAIPYLQQKMQVSGVTPPVIDKKEQKKEPLKLSDIWQVQNSKY